MVTVKSGIGFPGVGGVLIPYAGTSSVANKSVDSAVRCGDLRAGGVAMEEYGEEAGHVEAEDKKTSLSLKRLCYGFSSVFRVPEIGLCLISVSGWAGVRATYGISLST